MEAASNMYSNASNEEFVFAYPSPSMLSDAHSLSDSEWSTVSESSNVSASSTPPVSPVLKIEVKNEVTEFLSKASWPSIMQKASPETLPGVPPRWSIPTPPPTPKRTRIPRPPNAFMLYRSDLIRSGKIPEGVEHRQQTISRVAGECWNMLHFEEKEKWHQKAKEVLKQHMLKYPDYKFSPERKVSRKSKLDALSLGREDKNKKGYIRHLRETYLDIVGPAVPSPRPRKSKSRKSKIQSNSLDQAVYLPLPHSMVALPTPSSGTSSSYVPPNVAPDCMFPDTTTTHPSGLSIMSSSSAAQLSAPILSFASQSLPASLLLNGQTASSSSNIFQDNDMTPTAATFGYIPPPPLPQNICRSSCSTQSSPVKTYGYDAHPNLRDVSSLDTPLTLQLEQPRLPSSSTTRAEQQTSDDLSLLQSIFSDSFLATLSEPDHPTAGLGDSMDTTLDGSPLPSLDDWGFFQTFRS
ncbi:hypothetical protein AcW2_006577 [Taiwanofungus camphoratus]|nr:hypothetical protein AcW2_006577 [Antrodia cinnamomea]